MKAFYDESYPGHWFEPSMASVHPYCGLRVDGRLVSVAGTHVYSAERRVAALGNIATRPEWRGLGLAARTTAALCRQLLTTVDIIGLNVKSDNAPAIACYRELGFDVIAPYGEFSVGVLNGFGDPPREYAEIRGHTTQFP